MSAYDPMPTRQCPLIAPLLPRRESKDLHRIEHRRGPALGERHAATRWKRTACEGTAHDEAWRSVSNGGPIRVAARPFAASDVEAAFDGFWHIYAAKEHKGYPNGTTPVRFQRVPLAGGTAPPKFYMCFIGTH
jgi:hypothetical protein